MDGLLLLGLLLIAAGAGGLVGLLWVLSGREYRRW